MSLYGTPFCSDEELLEELNKLGYDEVSPDIFNMMKDDLSELVEKEQDELPLSEYDNDISPLSSDFLSPLSDALLETRTKQQTGKKTDSSVPRKVKKKSQNKSSRAVKDCDSENFGVESSRWQNIVSGLKTKSSSNVSLDIENIYDISGEDTFAEIDSVKKKSQNKSSRAVKDCDSENLGVESSRWQNIVSGLKTKSSSNVSPDIENIYDISGEDTFAEIDGSKNKYDRADELNSNEYHSTLRSTRADATNRNEDIKYKNISKSYKSKENDFQLGYSTKNDKYASNSDVSVSKHRSNASKDSKYTNSYGKSYDQAYSLSNTRKTATDNSMKSVRDAFKTFKLDKNSPESKEFLLNNYKGSDINLNTSSQSSINSETKTIKRKVLRRRNGRSVITEELVEIPVFDTSYPESENFNSSKSFSTDDLSCKSNGSTGSITAVSPESIKSSPSTFSLLSTRSTSFRVPNLRKKKSDPVAMYGYYRKFWENFKPPGENTHDRLRWAVRDKMLEYNI